MDTEQIWTTSQADNSTVIPNQVWLIIAVGILIRVVWAWLVPVIPVSDEVAYDAFATNLSQHGVFGWEPHLPSAFWPPGTSFLHAAAYLVFGQTYAGITLINILASLGIFILSFRIAARFFGRQVAMLTVLILVFWPSLVMFPTILASELPYLLLTMAALDLWSATDNKSIVRCIVIGALLGFAALVRPVALLIPAIYAFSMISMRGWKLPAIWQETRALLIVAVVMALVIMPWTVRNAGIFDSTVLISTNGPVTLWMGNTDGTSGSHVKIPPELDNLPDDKVADILGKRATEYILSDPMSFGIRFVKKVFLLYSNESIAVVWNAPGITEAFGPRFVTPLKWLTRITWALIFLSALYGFFLFIRRAGFWTAVFSPFFVSIAFYTVVYSITVAQDRYHISYATLFAIFSAIALSSRLWPMQQSGTVVMSGPRSH